MADWLSEKSVVGVKVMSKGGNEARGLLWLHMCKVGGNYMAGFHLVFSNNSNNDSDTEEELTWIVMVS